MDISVNFIEGIMGTAIVGLVGWVWFLHAELVRVQIDLAKNYHSKEELRQVIVDALAPLRDEVARLSRILERRSFDRDDPL